jgi:hypothetical protein
MGYSSMRLKPLFYVLSGMLLMALVISIARTSLFYFCYIPLIAAAFLFSGESKPAKEIRLPSKTNRLMGVVSGILFGELIFALLLLAQNKLSFQFHSSQNDWAVIGIEVVLGIAVFVLFFGIAVAGKFIVSKKR